ncbi:hypothetical protein [Prosthecobacter sp.]|uniref:hypothetical protein n=1 Tax=Prosthecobacter sp. TaxID=1965333 RepID=UPI00248942C6|nr:hypothetical protein [Prosthecobacter sp.]MDI1315039.1 hypothetical protein [Prosthecobacter sp.]
MNQPSYSLKRNFSRREFAALSSSGLCSVLTGTVLQGGKAADGEHDPAEKRLVLLGLNALSRAHEMNYFTDGHRGASLVSAHLMCVDNQMDDKATARIAQLFDLNWASSPLCKPFPEEAPDPALISKIGLALAGGQGVLREVGHNAIFAMLAIKGFRMLPSAATPKRIDGVCKLIRAIKPWRDIDPRPEVDPPPFSDTAAASEFVLREASATVDRFMGHGQGFTGHMLTFGQALVELAAMGDVEWAESCRTAFRKYVSVTRNGPQPEDKTRAEHKPSALRPNSAEYWEKRGDHAVDIGHVFKYPYSYYDLLRHVDNPALKQEWEGKAYHLF